jgi:molecular chaperone GrpE
MTDAPVESSEVHERLDQLVDLFRRRLLDDREKARQFDALYEELRAARALVAGEVLIPLVRQILLVLDRLDNEGSDFAQSVADELVEALRLHGFDPIDVSNEAFDPARQEVAGYQTVANADDHGTVVAVVRRGLRRGDIVVRPVHVMLGSVADA